jgi:hypothetical protein
MAHIDTGFDHTALLKCKLKTELGQLYSTLTPKERYCNGCQFYRFQQASPIPQAGCIAICDKYGVMWGTARSDEANRLIECILDNGKEVAKGSPMINASVEGGGKIQ